MHRSYRKFDLGEDRFEINMLIQKEYSGKIIEHNRDLTPLEKTALSEYISSGYRDINSYLRSRPISSGRLDQVKQFVSALSSLLQRKSIPENLILYRGRLANEFIDNDRESNSNLICDPAFVSTSLNKFVAFRFIVNNNPSACRQIELHEIRVPEGSKGFLVEFGAGESEVILPTETRFKIIERNPDVEINYYGCRVKVTKLVLDVHDAVP